MRVHGIASRIYIRLLIQAGTCTGATIHHPLHFESSTTTDIAYVRHLSVLLSFALATRVGKLLMWTSWVAERST